MRRGRELGGRPASGGHRSLLNPSPTPSSARAVKQMVSYRRGRYRNNLPMVLVVEQHARLESWPVLTSVRNAFLRIADRKGHAVARLSS